MSKASVAKWLIREYRAARVADGAEFLLRFKYKSWYQQVHSHFCRDRAGRYATGYSTNWSMILWPQRFTELYNHMYMNSYIHYVYIPAWTTWLLEPWGQGSNLSVDLDIVWSSSEIYFFGWLCAYFLGLSDCLVSFCMLYRLPYRRNNKCMEHLLNEQWKIQRKSAFCSRCLRTTILSLPQ